MRTNGRRNLLRVSVAVLVLASFVFAKTSTQVVVVPIANMYSAPTGKSDVVSQAIYGSNVTLLVARGEWCKIQTSDHYKGWTSSHYLRLIQSGPGYAITGKVVQVESLFANVYHEPDVTRHKPVITIPFETRLEVVEEEEEQSQGKGRRPAAKQSYEGWLQVRLPDKRIEWIQSSDVVPDPKPRSIAESIDLAKRFMGLPYLWGGRSSFGFDCSGFTQMLYRARGINLPRDADKQAAWTGLIAVDRKDLQPGDLLFFGSSPKDITHTGMYIGDGEFIHDTTNGHPVVQISRVEDEPWSKLLVASRRAK